MSVFTGLLVGFSFFEILSPFFFIFPEKTSTVADVVMGQMIEISWMSWSWYWEEIYFLSFPGFWNMSTRRKPNAMYIVSTNNCIYIYRQCILTQFLHFHKHIRLKLKVPECLQHSCDKDGFLVGFCKGCTAWYWSRRLDSCKVARSKD